MVDRRAEEAERREAEEQRTIPAAQAMPRTGRFCARRCDRFHARPLDRSLRSARCLSFCCSLR
jgi:hypothetical protein